MFESGGETLNFYLCLYFGHETCEILVPKPEIEPLPLQWKHGVLITGLPGKSQIFNLVQSVLRPHLAAGWGRPRRGGHSRC